MKKVDSKEPEVPRRLFTQKCFHASQVVHIGPCIVGNVAITSTDGVGLAHVYNGPNALAEHKFCLACIQDTTFGTGAAQDHYFDKGIYITVDASTTHAMISYYPIEV